MLIERVDDAGALAHESVWRWTLSTRVLAALKGADGMDAGLRNIARLAPRIATEVVAREQEVDAVDDALTRGGLVCVVSGAAGVGRGSLVLDRSCRKKLRLLEVFVSRFAKDAAPQLRAIARECKLLGCVPLLRDVTAEHIDVIGTELAVQLDGPILVTCGIERPVIKWDRPVVVVEMPAPTTEQRAELWKRSLEVSDGDADLLAERYPLAPGLIVRASEAAKARANGRKLGQEDVFAGIRAVLDDKLGTYAKRVQVTQTWDDLVLPQDQLDPITELMARVRGRRRVYEQWGFAAKVGKGLGVSALFSGPPGTGKTMVAALIAKELGLELYQVDMAKLVSKYIGETEKHLAAMFDAAEAGHAILLFDECDSLFGRRTEVRTSNDRYANLETNYLLQRLESFTGICLLTTNHETNLDPAFHRRLSLHVRFDLPDERERAKLWRAVLPAAAPIATDVDFAGLARRYEMSGGYIKNAALRAAFLAADEDAPIGAAHLERAARVEYEAMGKLAA